MSVRSGSLPRTRSQRTFIFKGSVKISFIAGTTKGMEDIFHAVIIRYCEYGTTDALCAKDSGLRHVMNCSDESH